MKADTPDLLKFKRLQRRLTINTAQLVGHLELLWRATAKNAPEGDIGRFSNEDIAIACHWDDDPDTFVDALIECGWLDRSDEWRLLVHDWAQHAPTYVHGSLRRHGRSFRTHTAEPPKEVTKEAPKEFTIVGSPEDVPTKSSQVKSSQAQSNRGNAGVGDEPRIPKKLDTNRFKDAFGRWQGVIARESLNGKCANPISLEATLEKLASYSERKACGFVLAWIDKRRVYTDWKADWESYQPEDIPIEPADVVYEPRQKPKPKVVNA